MAENSVDSVGIYPNVLRCRQDNSRQKMLRPLLCAALADFEEIRKKGFVYVDKARFIETMDRLPCGVVRMIHPSRFVKTLFTIALVPY